MVDNVSTYERLQLFTQYVLILALNSDSVNVLTLQQSIEVIEKFEKENSCQKPDVDYGKSQIGKIAWDKERIIAKFNKGVHVNKGNFVLWYMF